MGRQAEEVRRARLEVSGVDKHGRNIRVGITNKGGSTAKNCYAKITIDHTQGDVIDASRYGIPAFITINEDEYAQVTEMSLCWSFAGNPPQMDIGMDNTERFELARLIENQSGNTPVIFFDIPSEQGYGHETEFAGRVPINAVIEPRKKSRIALNARTYTGSILIGGDNVDKIKKGFNLVYDNNMRKAYVELRI